MVIWHGNDLVLKYLKFKVMFYVLVFCCRLIWSQVAGCTSLWNSLAVSQMVRNITVLPLLFIIIACPAGKFNYIVLLYSSIFSCFNIIIQCYVLSLVFFTQNL